jgi:hypothetical protein
MNNYEDVFIQCAKGIRPRLLELHQSSTYRGLLDGGPNHEINEMLLEQITEYAHGSVPIHLVRPAETPIPGVRRPSLYGPRVTLPQLVCRGLFENGTHWLWIVWFQDRWAPPIETVVEEELRSLDFLALAKDEISQW